MVHRIGYFWYTHMSIASYIKPQGKKGLYGFRRRVPSDLTQIWNNGQPQREYKVALKTTDKALALKRGADANLAFEEKVHILRRQQQDAEQKTVLERLEERRWIIQAATEMLKTEGVLPSQQPNLSTGASLNEILDWQEQVEVFKGFIVDDLQYRYLDHEQRQKDYDAGRWGRDGYKDPYKPVNPNDKDAVAYEIITGQTPHQSVEPTWKDCVELYIDHNKAASQRTAHNQKKHEQRVWSIADDLAAFIGNGNKQVGYTTQLDQFTRLMMRGFQSYCSKRHPSWKTATYNKGITLLSAIFNAGIQVFELSLNNPFRDLKINKTAAHVSGVEDQDHERRSFTPEELEQYVGHLNDKKPQIKAIGLLMIHTGCRTMELGGLMNEDLVLGSNVPYLNIRPNRIRRLKTLSSERRIPLTSDALDILRKYQEQPTNEDPKAPLFPKYGRDGGMDALSQGLRNIIRKTMGISDPRLVPYSTRHTLKDKMRLLRTPLSYQHHIMGHAQGNAIADGYGEGDPLIYIQEELERASQLTTWGPEAML